MDKFIPDPPTGGCFMVCEECGFRIQIPIVNVGCGLGFTYTRKPIDSCLDEADMLTGETMRERLERKIGCRECGTAGTMKITETVDVKREDEEWNFGGYIGEGK